MDLARVEQRRLDRLIGCAFERPLLQPVRVLLGPFELHTLMFIQIADQLVVQNEFVDGEQREMAVELGADGERQRRVQIFDEARRTVHVDGLLGDFRLQSGHEAADDQVRQAVERVRHEGTDEYPVDAQHTT